MRLCQNLLESNTALLIALPMRIRASFIEVVSRFAGLQEIARIDAFVWCIGGKVAVRVLMIHDTPLWRWPLSSQELLVVIVPDKLTNKRRVSGGAWIAPVPDAILTPSLLTSHDRSPSTRVSVALRIKLGETPVPPPRLGSSLLSRAAT